jgi:type IV secretory pathway TrbF-like protein
MLEPHGQRDGIATAAYGSRVTAVQQLEEAQREQAHSVVRIYKRDAGLLMCVILETLLLAVAMLVVYWQGMHGVRIEYELIVMDHLGNVMPKIRLSDETVTPEVAQIMGMLTHWVYWQRVLGDDPVATAQNWATADLYTSNAAIAQLETYRREQKVRQQDQHRRIEVADVRVLPIPKSRSYIVEWDEHVRDEQGRLVREECGKWKAQLTIGDFQSAAVRELRKERLQRKEFRNPLGILVDGIQWHGQPMYLTVPPKGS